MSIQIIRCIIEPSIRNFFEKLVVLGFVFKLSVHLRPINDFLLKITNKHLIYNIFDGNAL